MGVRKLNDWIEAGLIDAATADRIRAHEAEHARPLALWAAFGIGALAIGLGVISVIAANWEDVPGQVRLAIHLALIGALAGFILLRGERIGRDQPWGLEVTLFLLGVLGLAFFGHLGQVYQTGSPLWQPLAIWLVLFAPLMLMRGQSWLLAVLVMGTLVYACWDYAFAYDRYFGAEQQLPDSWLALVTALPLLAAPLGAWMRGGARESFWRRLEQLGLTYGVGGASLVAIAAGIEEFRENIMALDSQSVRAALALAAASLVYLTRRNASGEASAAVIAGSGILCLIAYPVSGEALAGGLLLMALWIGIAAAALHAGWRGVFQISVAIVALRLIILSFELASDLLTSGFGLILAGLLILGIAWGALRISRHYAPTSGEAK
ncbi:MAG: hypothetical protein APF82_04665 [Sphingomonadales bacterium BRH_c42]|nr:MAG: hypothetical protein APF82_04665 [Sphingomonadales bacterium BRH_c42]